MGYALICTGTCICFFTLLIGVLTSFGSFGYALWNMANMQQDFAITFQSHIKAMGGMAGGMAIAIIGSMIGAAVALVGAIMMVAAATS